MAKRTTKSAKSNNSKEASSPQPPPTLDEQLIDALRPWLVEIGGISMALLALAGLLAAVGWNHSAFLLGLTGWISYFFGWWAYVILLLLIGVGIHIATRRVADKRPYHFTTKQIVGVELLLLTALPLSHLLSGNDLTGAQIGRGGGLIGWALSEPLLDFFGRLPTYAFYFLLLLAGLAFVFSITLKTVIHWFERTSKKLQQWAYKIAPAGSQVPRRQRPVIGTAKLPLENAKTDKKPPIIKRDPRLPAYNLLEQAQTVAVDHSEIESKKAIIEKTLLDFGLPAKVVSELVGPAITQFGVRPGHIERPGPDGKPQKYRVRVGQIARLNKDLALALAAARVRIEAPVPGKGIVGIEVPNSEISTVRLGTLVTSETFRRKGGTLGIALGEDVSGAPVVADVTRLPHMLVAGQTGSGKSVFINALISCLVFNKTPDELQLVMIDPKKVELIRFNGLPHLLGKVEVEGERAIGVLRWLTAEMDERYRKFAEVGARNLEAYNRSIAKYTDVKPLAHIVAFIDELADLMVEFGGDVEGTLCRLAQMARATGIHLIVATQRPSTDVLTGLIKANFPSRVSFAVASGVDSRVILDSVGAEHLLGQGDMLYVAADASVPVRIQGCFVSDEEIDRLVNHWRKISPEQQSGRAPWENLIDKITFIEETDDLLERAIALAQRYDTLSTSLLQRRLRVGFPRAARLMETLFEMGLVEDAKNGGKTRKVYTDELVDDPLAEFLEQHGEEYVNYRDKPNFDKDE